MSSWVVRLALALAVCCPLLAVGQARTVSVVLPEGQVLAQAPMSAEPVFRQLQPSIVDLLNANQESCGWAAMIDPSGLYVAHRVSVAGTEVNGWFWNGTLAHLHVIGEDTATQLVLLRSDYIPPDARAVAPPLKDTDPGTPLVVIVGNGAVRGRLESTDLLGVLRPSNRMLPLNEIRLETPIGSLGGALVFTESGEFMGVLNATLSRHTQAVFSNAPNAAAAVRDGNPLQSRNSNGPADLTVAYTPGLDVVRKVVDGFLSATHEVAHPTMGIFCRDGVRGALVTTVQPGSPADKAGLRPSDMIVGIGSYQIRNALDFAKVLFRLKPGDHVIVRLDRGGRAMTRTVIIGQLAD